ncbi:MAG: thioesterase family protein, partial [Anaerolineae bacterium]|nr:thioesterase family protein [Anaerolineae bacterium]
MIPTHTSTFTIRYYECDAYGHLNNANYLRLMQEAAFDASAAVGYAKERYEAMGYLWLAHETEIEYMRPLHYGDQVEIKTWVADFRQVRSVRHYEFRRSGSEELVAKAHTDWVYMERDSSRAARIPPEMAAAFSGGETLERMPRTPFPEPPPAPAGAFRLRHRVEWRDIDGAQHLNNAAYINYIEDAGIQTGAHYHWSFERAAEQGLGAVFQRHRIEYIQPALLDDEVEISTWLYHMGRASGIRHFDLRRAQDDVLLARVQSHW